MRDISFNLSGKINSLLAEVLGLISHEATRMDIPFFIVGAIARDIIFEYCYNCPARRGTSDLDIGIEVAGWEDFNRLFQALISTGKFEATREPHVLMYSDLRIDVVPFGGVSSDQKSISWPPEHDMKMNVQGFKEAYDSSILIQINDSPILQVSVPTVPGMALMKIISWNDRYPGRPKDAQDMLFLMENYMSVVNEDRLYGEEASFMEEEGYDIEMASIRLLGHDMATIASMQTGEQVLEILSKELDEDDDHGHTYHLIRDMTGSSVFAGDRFDEIYNKLVRLKQGFNEYFQRKFP